MTPPVLLDLTGDGVEDIVMRMYDSETIAFNGDTYEQLWKSSVPGSESYRFVCLFVCSLDVLQVYA